jgi:hypothetical protein
MPLDDEQWSALARELRGATARAAPGWTDSGGHDPGVTVLELLAYALADLRHRSSALSPHARGLAQEVARHAAALATTTASNDDDVGGGLRRVSYFAGQLLGVDDFQTEQDYLLDRLSRRNRLLHGAGIVDGLAVTVEPGDGAPGIVIAPGLAFDPRGREICVDAPCRLALPAATAALLVQLTYREQQCASVVAPAGTPRDATADDAAGRPSRVVETFAATLAEAPSADAVTLAQLHRLRGRWRVDAKLKPLRARR